MIIDFLIDRFKENPNKDAIMWKDKKYNYSWLLKQIDYWKERIEREKIQKGQIVVLNADFSPNAVALFLTLMNHKCVIIPLTNSVEDKKKDFIEISQGEVAITLDKNDESKIEFLKRTADNKYYIELKRREHPGLVLFSSGSTGKSKAAVHDLMGILEKFKKERYSLRAITFLLYDHIGGVNTMLYTLSNTGCIITVQKRTPDYILKLIEKYKVELLPTSPTFINLILLSEAYKRYDLSSLKTISYGTEPMQESILKRFHSILPDIRLLQTYGLSEIGIMRSKSKSSDSLWVKVGGEGFETRIVDNILQIKAKSAMLGYLNVKSPFTEDGWFNTGDEVVVDGEYIKILGRKSEIINVGGEKVYPAEVESVIQEHPLISEVTVYGEKNPITGNIVCANITLKESIEKKKIIAELKKFCRGKLEIYKVPVKIKIVEEKLHSARFKKMRRQ